MEKCLRRLFLKKPQALNLSYLDYFSKSIILTTKIGLLFGTQFINSIIPGIDMYELLGYKTYKEMRELADEIENDKDLSEKYELEQSENVVNSKEEIEHEDIVETEEDNEVETSGEETEEDNEVETSGEETEEDNEVETSSGENSETESSVLEDSCSDCDNEIEKLANDIIDKVVESNL